MDKFTLYLQKFDILQNVTDEEITKSETLLRTYGPMLRSAAQGIDELEEECYAGRRQSISDFINLAIDYDRDADRQRIAGAWPIWDTPCSCSPFWKLRCCL